MFHHRKTIRRGLVALAAFFAARCFLKYRKAGGVRTSTLPDFFIGAHATVAGMTLMTRDVSRYRTYFPDTALLCPQDHA